MCSKLTINAFPLFIRRWVIQNAEIQKSSKIWNFTLLLHLGNNCQRTSVVFFPSCNIFIRLSPSPFFHFYVKVSTRV